VPVPLSALSKGQVRQFLFKLVSLVNQLVNLGLDVIVRHSFGLRLDFGVADGEFRKVD
jgi:hypothetical protein